MCEDGEWSEEGRKGQEKCQWCHMGTIPTYVPPFQQGDVTNDPSPDLCPSAVSHARAKIPERVFIIPSVSVIQGKYSQLLIIGPIFQESAVLSFKDEDAPDPILGQKDFLHLSLPLGPVQVRDGGNGSHAWV